MQESVFILRVQKGQTHQGKVLCCNSPGYISRQRLGKTGYERSCEGTEKTDAGRQRNLSHVQSQRARQCIVLYLDRVDNVKPTILPNQVHALQLNSCICQCFVGFTDCGVVNLVEFVLHLVLPACQMTGIVGEAEVLKNLFDRALLIVSLVQGLNG